MAELAESKAVGPPATSDCCEAEAQADCCEPDREGGVLHSRVL